MSSKVSILVGLFLFQIAEASSQLHFLRQSASTCRTHNIFFYWEQKTGQHLNLCHANLQFWFCCMLGVICAMIAYILSQAITNLIEGIDRRKKYRYFE